MQEEGFSFFFEMSNFFFKKGNSEYVFSNVIGGKPCIGVWTNHKGKNYFDETVSFTFYKGFFPPKGQKESYLLFAVNLSITSEYEYFCLWLISQGEGMGEG